MFRRSSTRRAVQAGRFYDADPKRLEAGIHDLMDQASPGTVPGKVLAPHAGYVYSGAVAEAAYRTLEGRVFDGVLIGAPSHYRDFTGSALPSSEAFETPLGTLEVDREGVEELHGHPLFIVDDRKHEQEHSIEVQLPFLQVSLEGPFKILPMLLGRADPQQMNQLTEALDGFLGHRRERGESWLIVASSDTYHGHDVGACQANDRRIIKLIEEMDPETFSEQARGGEVMACGWRPLTLAMGLARRAGARSAQCLDRRDSSQTGGTVSDYVVGYVAAAFS